MPTPKLVIRNLVAPVELRASKAGLAPNRLVGYAAKFNQPYQPFPDWPEFSEVLDPGCFERTLREMPDVLALANHDPDKVLGRVSAGTLRLRVDNVGLGFEVDLPDTSAGRDVKVSVGRRDIVGCSFGFVVVQEDQAKGDDGLVVRTLLDVDLYEITPACTFPANAETSVDLRRLTNRRSSTPSLDLAVRRLQLLDLGRVR